MSHPLWRPLAKNIDPNCVHYQVLRLLREVGHLTPAQLRERRPDITSVMCAQHLYKLDRVGHCWSARITRKRVVYFSTPEARDEYIAKGGIGGIGYIEPLKPKPPRAPSYVKADPEAPAIVPAHVKVQVCPHWTHDPRIQFPPDLKRLPPDMQGAGFVAEWNRLRTTKKETASC
jgi:hypothetical protein